MSKTARLAKAHSRRTRASWPLVIYVWVIGLGLTSYLVARIALDGQPHPLHWASGLAGAIIGYPIGWLWYRWRGDVA